MDYSDFVKAGTQLPFGLEARQRVIVIDETIYVFTNDFVSGYNDTLNVTISLDADGTIDIVLVNTETILDDVVDSPCAVYDSNHNYVWFLGGLINDTMNGTNFVETSASSFFNVFDVTSQTFISISNVIDETNIGNSYIIEAYLYLNDGTCHYSTDANKLLYIGGHNYNVGDYSKSILIYDIGANRWDIEEDILRSSHTFGDAAMLNVRDGDILYVIGGINDDEDDEISVIEEYNLSSSEIISRQTINTPMVYISAIALDDNIYLNKDNDFFISDYGIIIHSLFMVGTVNDEEFDSVTYWKKIEIKPRCIRQ